MNDKILSLFAALTLTGGGLGLRDILLLRELFQFEHIDLVCEAYVSRM